MIGARLHGSEDVGEGEALIADGRSPHLHQTRHGSAQASDRRENHQLAQPLPQTGQGLGMSEPQRPRIPPLGLNTPHVAKALSLNAMISEGL